MKEFSKYLGNMTTDYHSPLQIHCMEIKKKNYMTTSSRLTYSIYKNTNDSMLKIEKQSNKP